MTHVSKVWILSMTTDPYDLQWGNPTESQIIGVFSTLENAREELSICRKDLEKIYNESENRIYGDFKTGLYYGGAHVLFVISEHILDYVNH